MESLNRPTMSKETESVIKKLTKRKTQGFMADLYQTFEEELILVPLNLFQDTKEEGHFQTHSMTPLTTRYQKKIP